MLSNSGPLKLITGHSLRPTRSGLTQLKRMAYVLNTIVLRDFTISFIISVDFNIMAKVNFLVFWSEIKLTESRIMGGYIGALWQISFFCNICLW